MRQRTSAAPGFDYQVERHNYEWCDHIARTNVTAALITWLQPHSIIDPACGDSSIVWVADQMRRIDRIRLSDISQPNLDAMERQWSGHLGVTRTCQDIISVTTDVRSDVVVLTEVLEHLLYPDEILRQARKWGDRLVASSPEMRAGQTDTNPEHLWMFDSDGYMEMLIAAGWVPIQKTGLAFLGLEYDFQIWVCR